jgi:hypothetical protein
MPTRVDPEVVQLYICFNLRQLPVFVDRVTWRTYDHMHVVSVAFNIANAQFLFSLFKPDNYRSR